MTGWVYRHYSAENQLLYIGSTVNLAKRDASHIKHSPWRALSARRDDEPYETIFAARVAENTAIRQENPIHNQDRSSWKSFGYEQPRKQLVSISLTYRQRDELRKRAIHLGISMPDYLRRLLDEHIDGPLFKAADNRETA